MAMDVGGKRGGVISSINVTPMADVIIVLLIIFMVTVPVITRQVDLPDAVRAQTRKDGPIVITIRSDGSISLSDQGVVAPFELAARIREQRAGGEAVVQVSADQGLDFVRVAEVLAACRQAGAEEVAITTEERVPSS